MKKFKISSIFPINKKPITSGKILINGKMLVFIVCSIVSGLINLIFICNLTKTPYTLGTLLSIPAAILLGVLSVSLDLSKALHVIQVNTLNELYRFLNGESWASKIKKISNKWNRVYVLYVVLSIITSVSLSTISIGEGISRNRSIINSINSDISELTMYSDTNKTSDNIEFNSLLKSVNNSDNAINLAQQKFSEIESEIKSYRQERAEFPVSFNSKEKIDYNGDKIIPDEYWTKKNDEILKKVNASGISLTMNQIRTMSYSDIQMKVKNSQELLTKNNSVNKLSELSEKTNNKAYSKIKNLNGRYIYPDTWKNGIYIKGQDVVFSDNDISGAIDKLNDLKTKYENDSGDIGSSSKIFMQLGSAIDSIKSNKNNLDLTKVQNTKVSSFGTTELLMMGMLLFLSLLCELAINQFSPKVIISREMLSQFSQYFPSDFDVNVFMKKVAYSERDFGEISDKEFQTEIKYCDDRIAKKNPNNENKKIDSLIKDIDSELGGKNE